VFIVGRDERAHLDAPAGQFCAVANGHGQRDFVAQGDYGRSRTAGTVTPEKWKPQPFASTMLVREKG
jgi:hypothetical protein